MSIPSENAVITFTGKEQAELRREPVRAPGEGEVLVRTTATLISTGTETICYGRRFDPGTHWDRWVQYPFRTGYSHAGVVETLGAGVEGLKPGDRVASTFGHAQVVTAPAARFHVIPEGVSDRDAAWLTLAKIVQNGVRRAAHTLGEDIVVVGLGPLGQLTVQYARLAGARTLVAVDPDAARLEMAKAHGATHTLAAGVDAAVEAVQAITKGRMASAVYDMTGNDKVFAGAQGLLRRFGKLVLIGDTGSPAGQYLTPAVIRKSLQIVASHSANTPPEETDFTPWTGDAMVRLFFEYLVDGRMAVSDLNTHVFKPAECQAAYQKLLHNRAGTMGCHFEW